MASAAGVSRAAGAGGQPDVPAKVELGRYLFYDLRMSVNGEGSCSTCHIQKYGFTNQLPVAIGVTGQSHPRRAMPLANVAWFAIFNWANPTVTRLEDQSLTPMFGDHPVELGLKPENDKFLRVVASDPCICGCFRWRFPAMRGRILSFTFARRWRPLSAR